MTNNEVIIDGVDVSDCCYIQDGGECEVYQTECEAQFCYYQQLKHKEKECEKLKSALEETIKVIQKCVDCASKNHYSCGTCGRYDLLQKIKKITKEQE